MSARASEQSPSRGADYETSDFARFVAYFLGWAEDYRVALHRASRPMQDGYIESFNGRMRDELLNESLFIDLDQARQLIGTWITDYNTARPHSSLGYKTPAAYAGTLAQGRKLAEALTAAGCAFSGRSRPTKVRQPARRTD